jgi:hypothetical protein
LMRDSGSLVEDAGIRTMICKEVLKNACELRRGRLHRLRLNVARSKDES